MRPALRLLATLRRGQYLEPGTPTGLTGLLTANSPRSQLLYLYNSTLEKLEQFPEHSVYRQSTEALTRHRMSIIESVRPEGLEAWQNRVAHLVDEHPEAFKKIEGLHGHNIVYAPSEVPVTSDEKRIKEEYRAKPIFEGPKEEETDAVEIKTMERELARDLVRERASALSIESEPPLSVEQVGQVESEIGAGLIEEVIAVAENERRLVDTLAESKVWEDLEEKAAPGQWDYFQRDTFTKGT